MKRIDLFGIFLASFLALTPFTLDAGSIIRLQPDAEASRLSEMLFSEPFLSEGDRISYFINKGRAITATLDKNCSFEIKNAPEGKFVLKIAYPAVPDKTSFKKVNCALNHIQSQKGTGLNKTNMPIKFEASVKEGDKDVTVLYSLPYSVIDLGFEGLSIQDEIKYVRFSDGMESTTVQVSDLLSLDCRIYTVRPADNSKKYLSLDVFVDTQIWTCKDSITCVAKPDSITEVNVDVSHMDKNQFKIGDIYDNGIKRGIVFYIDRSKRFGKIIEMESNPQASWSVPEYVGVVTTARDLKDGMVNCREIQLNKDWNLNYPAFLMVEEKNVGGVTGWYLPSRDELEKEIFPAKNIINKVMGFGFLSGRYWSSSEYCVAATRHATAVNLDKGNKGPNGKSAPNKICAVSRF